MRQLVIGDIHGCLSTFEALLEQIAFSTSDELYLLGDYIDRGKDSKGVIDSIISLRNQGFKLHCLRGNHEEMTIESIINDRTNAAVEWKDAAFMKSFGISRMAQIEDKYLNFFESLDYYIEVSNYILVHAGLNFKVENPLSDFDAMLWIRNWYSKIDKEWLVNRIIIHGHTPVKVKETEKMLQNLDNSPVLNIDTGAVFGTNLTCLELNTHKLYTQKNKEKRSLFSFS